MWLRSCVFFFKQKTAYEMRISDWSSDVCSSDLARRLTQHEGEVFRRHAGWCIDNLDARHGRRYLPYDPRAGRVIDRCWVARNVVKIGRASCRARVCQYV